MTQKYILKTHFGGEENFHINYKEDLTPEQLPIVTSTGGPTLVIAGAGSGKTRTVTYRVAYLVESGIPLDRILLVTFTNKAAKEMTSRVELLLKRDVKGLWGGTFHHIGNLILRRNAKQIGYDPNFTILDRSDAKELIDACVGEAMIDIKARRFPKGDALQDIFSLALNTNRSIVDAIAYNYPQFEQQTAEIEGVGKLYTARKKKNNLMDFDDLLYYWWKVLAENKEIAEKYASKFLHILVDEYQDTNSLQAKVVDIMAKAHRNLMVVGDDSQSIYSFRGAHFKNIMNFPKVYPDAKIFKLETNHRSTPEILAIANTSIVLAKEKFDKNLKANRPSGDKPVVAPLTTVHEQAAFVAQRMLELREEGHSLNDMAVLYRSHYQSMEVQMELTKRGIPFEIRSGLRFFEEAHIKDVLAYLKVFQNPKDEISWTRILKLLPKIGPKTAEKIFQYLVAAKDPILAVLEESARALVPSLGERHFRAFQSVMAELKDKVGSPSEMIKIISESSYAEHLKTAYPNYRERLEDLAQLGSYSTQYKSLEELLSQLALASGIESETIAGAGEKEKEVCVLSTVHQAKGLEWKIVFLVWLADGRFPSYLSFNKDDEMEEERRLFYVAVTRAKDELYMTYPLIYSGYEGEVLMKQSRFLEELPSWTFDKWEVEPQVGYNREEDEVVDLSQFREVKVRSKDDFEAIDIADLFK
ncbi:MAG: ATP-dependent helicase [bacterium]